MECSVCEVFESELSRLEEIHHELAVALGKIPTTAINERDPLLKAVRIAKLHLVDAQYDFSRHRQKEHAM
jgi:hypothetical protein